METPRREDTTEETMAWLRQVLRTETQKLPAASWVARDSAEWVKMWSAIAHPEEGEGWQYMGTVDGWHEFRNRNINGARRYTKVKAGA